MKDDKMNHMETRNPRGLAANETGSRPRLGPDIPRISFTLKILWSFKPEFLSQSQTKHSKALSLSVVTFFRPSHRVKVFCYVRKMKAVMMD